MLVTGPDLLARMEPARGYLGDLAAGLRWRRTDLIAMLWAYFDESGVHDSTTGHLRRLTFGGCLSSLKDWSGFESEWRDVLGGEGIDCFHMTDFEKWRGPFDFRLSDGSRDVERHKHVLNRLLEVMARHIKYTYGFTRNVTKPSKALADTYESCVIDSIMHLANASAYQFGDKVSIIFARHKDFALPRIEQYFGFMNYGDARLGTVGTDTPQNLCELQAADIVGYEVSRMERDGATPRYPLKKLKELGCQFRFSTGFP